MLKNRQPYYWPISRIVEEYELILKSECKLPSGQRRVIKTIYEQKLKKGLIPGQKEAFTGEMNTITSVVRVLVDRIREGLNMPGVAITDFTLVTELPQPGEVGRFYLAYKGDFLGWIIVYKVNQTYNAKYYVEDPEKQGRAQETGPDTEKKSAERGSNDKDDNPGSKEEVSEAD